MRKITTTAMSALAAAGLAVAGATAASAAPADGPGGQNVNASVTVQTGLTVTGVSGSIDFGSLTVGATSTKPGAETYEIATNSPGGYTVALSSNMQDWARTGFPGQFTGLGNNALSVKNAAGNTVKAQPLAHNPVNVETGPAGDNHISEDWSVAVPASFTGSGAMNNTFVLDIEPA